MDNPWVAFGAVLAVAFLVLLNWWLGGWRRARIADAQGATARYLEDFWNDRVREVAIDRDGHAALLQLVGEIPVVGLVVAHGDAFVTRRLTPGSVKSTQLADPDRLLLVLDDLVLPRVELRLEPALAANWRRRLDALLTRPRDFVQRV